MNSKIWWQSKTVWLAIAQAVIGVLAVVMAIDPSVKAAGIIALLKSVIDILNRISTDQPIRLN